MAGTGGGAGEGVTGRGTGRLPSHGILDGTGRETGIPVGSSNERPGHENWRGCGGAAPEEKNSNLVE